MRGDGGLGDRIYERLRSLGLEERNPLSPKDTAAVDQFHVWANVEEVPQPAAIGHMRCRHRLHQVAGGGQVGHQRRNPMALVPAGLAQRG